MKVDLEGKDNEDNNEEHDQGEKEGPRALDGLFQHWPPREQRDLFSRFANIHHQST